MSDNEINMVAFALLQRTAAFHGVEGDLLIELASIGRLKYFKKKDTIFDVGSASDGMYIVNTGRVGITTMFANGKELMLNILGPNELFGEIGALDGLPRTASAISQDDSSVVHLEGESLRRIVSEHPSLCRGLVSVLCSRLRWTSSIIEDTVFRDTRTRLAKRLLMLASTFGEETEDGVVIRMKFSQDALGRMLGVTRESITKEGAVFSSNGAVSFRYGIITIHDRQYLEEVAALS